MTETLQTIDHRVYAESWVVGVGLVTLHCLGVGEVVTRASLGSLKPNPFGRGRRVLGVRLRRRK